MRSQFEQVPDTVPAVVRIPLDLADGVRTVLQSQLATGQELIVVRRGADSVDVSGVYRFRRAVIGLCLRFGGQVEIIDPPDLRRDAYAAASAAAATHRSVSG